MHGSLGIVWTEGDEGHCAASPGSGSGVKTCAAVEEEEVALDAVGARTPGRWAGEAACLILSWKRRSKDGCGGRRGVARREVVIVEVPVGLVAADGDNWVDAGRAGMSLEPAGPVAARVPALDGRRLSG